MYVVFFLDAGRCACKKQQPASSRQTTTVIPFPDNWFVAKQIRRVCRVNTPNLVSKHAVFGEQTRRICLAEDVRRRAVRRHSGCCHGARRACSQRGIAAVLPVRAYCLSSLREKYRTGYHTARKLTTSTVTNTIATSVACMLTG